MQCEDVIATIKNILKERIDGEYRIVLENEYQEFILKFTNSKKIFNDVFCSLFPEKTKILVRV